MMKKITRYLSLVLFTVATFFFSACEKETQLPPREVSPEVAEIAENYTNILVESQQGWVLAYKPDQHEETIYFHLTFKDAEKVDMISGYRGYHTLQSDITYYYEGNYIPIIVFSGENVFSELASSYNGSYKFKIYYNEEQGTFELVRSDGFDDKRFELTRANDTNLALLNAQIQEVLDQIAYEEEQERLSAEVRAKIKAFVEIESDFYFYNLTVDDFSAGINSFDTIAREISLTYKPTPTSAPTTATVGYTLTPEGMVLNPTGTTVPLELLGLGELLYEDPDDSNKVTAIEVVSNGNVGTMGYAHVAPYPYTLSSNRNQTLADYFMDEYTSSVEFSNRLGPKTEGYRDDFRDYIRNLSGFNPTGRHTYIIYSPNFTTVGLRNLFWVGSSRSINGDPPYTNMGFNLRVDMQNLGNNVLSINDITSQTNSNHATAGPIPNISVRVQEYLDEVSPSEGVTMVPYNMANEGSSGYRLRLVSTLDSRIWLEYRWPSATYFNMVFD